MGRCSVLKGLLLRNKQDNQYGPRCPEPGTGTPEAPVAVVCVILGMWPMSPLPQESLVLHQCLWLQEPGLPWVISTPLGSQRVWSPPSLLPGSFHCPLTYLLDFFWIGWLWLSPLVLLDLSLKHKGMVSSCLEPTFHKKGTFRVPVTPAGLQDSGKGGGF